MQAFFNVNFSSNVASIPAGDEVTPGPEYDWDATTQIVSTPGTIKGVGVDGGVGGVSTYRIAPSPANAEQLLYSVPFYASSPGTSI